VEEISRNNHESFDSQGRTKMSDRDFIDKKDIFFIWLMYGKPYQGIGKRGL
jgi:hypothetical protein